METQLRLFPAPQPLVERLGVAFFLAIPREPGVYRMFDAAERLLYVGKAVNLRQRLSSYRRTHGQSRKTIRLVHCVHRIEWETCVSDAEARLLENRLIRSLRPPFNRAGTWPRSARFVVLGEMPDGFRCRLAPEPGEESYGAFRAPTGMALLAAARLAWLAARPGSHPLQLPHGLLTAPALVVWEWSGDDAALVLPLVRAFLAGDSDELLARWASAIAMPTDTFSQAFLARDIEVLEEFYRRGPRRVRELRALLPVGRETISPEEHDDFVVLAGGTPRVPPFRPGPNVPRATTDA